MGGTLPLAGPALNQNLGPRWANTVLGLLEVALIPVPLVFWRYGDKIRARSGVIRKLREESAKAERMQALRRGELEHQAGSKA